MSIVSQAERELKAINFGEPGTTVMLGILRDFLDEWDSGGAVAAVEPVFVRLLNGQPLSPLTGEDDEWMEVMGGALQNVRCSSVFKEGGRSYDINTKGRPTITFPYSPDTEMVRMPIYTVG